MFHHTVLTFICQVLIFICCLLIACGLRMQEPPQHVSTYTSMQSSREPVALANFTVQASQGFTAQSQLASIPSERGPLMHLSWPIPLSSWMSVGSGEHISKDDGDDDDDDDGDDDDDDDSTDEAASSVNMTQRLGALKELRYPDLHDMASNFTELIKWYIARHTARMTMLKGGHTDVSQTHGMTTTRKRKRGKGGFGRRKKMGFGMRLLMMDPAVECLNEGCPFCFPGGTKIITRSGMMTMDKLRIGDEVLGFNRLTHRTEYTEVRAWLHRVTSAKLPMIKLHTDVADIAASFDHLLAVASPDSYKSMHETNRGDALVTLNGTAVVLSSHEVTGEGLYAPLTFTYNLYVGSSDGDNATTFFLAHNFAGTYRYLRATESLLSVVFYVFEMFVPTINDVDDSGDTDYLHPIARLLRHFVKY
eukprot:gnl/TRDRNA2_/TRDRNA2_176482_c0_seq11.p1 gnl/TRDRNA2_/TRDRNA2_176482_c0~~gnl/TRDRNA2_/TRDRNA2_176482_c0_seq11.p1  ORF type:complete len:419 (+),score=39.36 gnl/TRDRNA2_/TRDRNA2_176482_c0_seq11:36-1292(+)